MSTQQKSGAREPKQPRAETPQPALLEGKVKSVISGDTLELAHPTKPVTKTLTLASINAPRLARRNETKEDPFAFEAREFLRKRCIGKKVKFQVEYTNPKTGRDYGSVFLDDKNLGEELLANGLANLKEKNDKNQTPEYLKLVEAEQRAKDAKLGVHQPKETLAKTYKQRSIVWAGKGFDAEAKLKSFKGKPVDVIVEHVLNGSSLRVQLPTHEMVVLHMTGVQAPTFKLEEVSGGEKKKGKDSKAEASAADDNEEEGKSKVRAQRVEIAQPLAKEARHYTEMRLLHREITVLFESTDKFNNFFGTIIINEDEKSKDPVTFQEALLLQGFAKLTEWGAARSKYLPRLRAAENEAKKQKIRIWKDYKPPEHTLTAQDAKEFSARVVEIVSGDTVRIKDDNGVEERVSLSSIRAPRMGGRNEPAEPWAIEARDCLRKQVAGKKVNVRVDYRKTIERPVFKLDKGTGKRVQTEEKETEDRRFVSIVVGGRSVAVELAKEGLVQVIRHKPGDERSLFYDQLMLAETDAEKKGKGRHGKKAPVHQINDVSSANVGEVSKIFKVLKDKQTKAVVEKVLSGTRFKLFLPQDSMIITFALNGLTSPSIRPKESPEKPKPFAREAIDFSTDNLLFREVNISIDNLDKTSFVGDLTVKGDNYAYKILEAGYAMLQRSAQKLKNYTELKQAENKAKGPYDEDKVDESGERSYPNGINVWSVPASVFRSAKAKTDKQREKVVSDRFQVLGGENNSHQARVTCVADINKFYIQTADAEADLAHLDELMAKLNLDQQQPPAQQPELGTLVFARYVDGVWYRAKVTENISPKDNKLAVLYIDFGNTERVGLNDLRPLNKETEVGKIHPVAQECSLAFVVPHEEKYREEATQTFKDMVEDRDLIAVFEYRDAGVTYITIEEGEGVESETVNQTLVRDGLVFVDSSLKYRRQLEKKINALQTLQNAAKDERRYLWEDGDVYADDDDFE